MSILSSQAKLNIKNEATWVDRWWFFCLLGITFIGTVFRLSSLSLIEFRHDSAYWALDAYRILQGGYLPLVGQQVGSVTVELYNGPIISYVTALIFTLFGYKPVFVAMFIATCNVAGIVITFLLGKRLYSRNTGLVAATLMSLSPWLILYGRMFWPQALFPCLIPLTLLVALQAIESNKFIWYLIFGILLGIGLQLHLSVMALIGTGILFTVCYSRYKVWSPILVGGGVLVGYSPIVLYDLLYGFVNLVGLARLPSLHAVDEPRIFHFAKTLWNFENVLSGQALWVSKLSDYSYLPAAIDWGQGILFTGLFLLALTMILTENLRNKPLKEAIKFSYQDGLLLLFVILPTAYLFLSRSLIQRHYFLFIYPAPLLIIARGIDLWQIRLREKGLSQGLSYVVPSAVAIACILNLTTVLYGYSFLVQSGGEGQYGTVLADKQSAVDFILAHSEGNYAVNVEAVQETLPYVFLFQSRNNNIVVEGREDIAGLISATTNQGSLNQYRIVEPTYHEITTSTEEKVLYKSRGVIVIGQEMEKQ